MLNHTPLKLSLKNSFLLVVSLRYPVKTSVEMDIYPAPPAAQLLTMLLQSKTFLFLFFRQFLQTRINPCLYLQNQVFRTDQTVCSGIHNNSASLCTDCLHVRATGAVVCFPDHHLCNNSSEDQLEVPLPYLAYTLHPV